GRDEGSQIGLGRAPQRSERRRGSLALLCQRLQRDRALYIRGSPQDAARHFRPERQAIVAVGHTLPLAWLSGDLDPIARRQAIGIASIVRAVATPHDLVNQR